MKLHRNELLALCVLLADVREIAAYTVGEGPRAVAFKDRPRSSSYLEYLVSEADVADATDTKESTTRAELKAVNTSPRKVGPSIESQETLSELMALLEETRTETEFNNQWPSLQNRQAISKDTRGNAEAPLADFQSDSGVELKDVSPDELWSRTPEIFEGKRVETEDEAWPKAPDTMETKGYEPLPAKIWDNTPVIKGVVETKTFTVTPKGSLPTIDLPLAPPEESSIALRNVEIPEMPKRELQLDTRRSSRNVWDTLNSVTIQGGSLRTWQFADSSIKSADVFLQTPDGRPLNAIIELWQGPSNTPQKMGIYTENGMLRKFRTVIETPRDRDMICVRNAGSMQFPLAAAVEVDCEDPLLLPDEFVGGERIQGGTLKTYGLEPSVRSVQLTLRTDGHPLNARIEVWQGPNSYKQVMELYTEDGMERPFTCVIDTPFGPSGSTIRIMNASPITDPLTAHLEPYEEDLW